MGRRERLRVPMGPSSHTSHARLGGLGDIESLEDLADRNRREDRGGREHPGRLEIRMRRVNPMRLASPVVRALQVSFRSPANPENLANPVVGEGEGLGRSWKYPKKNGFRLGRYRRRLDSMLAIPGAGCHGIFVRYRMMTRRNCIKCWPSPGLVRAATWKN